MGQGTLMAAAIDDRGPDDRLATGMRYIVVVLWTSLMYARKMETVSFLFFHGSEWAVAGPWM